MRLSAKFFCTAYLIVLLASGICGIVVIRSVTHALWEARVMQTETAAAYAAESWTALADLSPGKLSETKRTAMLRQIKASLDDSVSSVKAYSAEELSSEYRTLSHGEGFFRYVHKEERLFLEISCLLFNGGDSYCLILSSDFTDLQTQCRFFWNLYGIVVFSVAAVSGALLFLTAKKTTSPLNTLNKLAGEISAGNYGKKIRIKTSDREIASLSESFNTMSEAIRRKIGELTEEKENRDRFVGDFTHEMKTPMTAIIGYSQMLSSYDLSPAEQKEASKAICREAKRLEKLSLQLLELYVYRNDTIETELIETEALEEQLRTALIYSAKKYKMYLTVSLEPAAVTADGVLLLSLLYNLTDNGFKASRPGDTVEIVGKAQGGTYLFSVTDHGKGISPEHLKHITEPFYREDKARSRKLGGAGLGLSLCKEIASLHGTVLRFQSRPGEGTAVTFSLKMGGADDV
ncbi:MAG: HAMP domain-containing histidine kinase [Clostridia bacterium]|nr:HAMP domain-containing histidine kinase [Clostridia bacterium]